MPVLPAAGEPGAAQRVFDTVAGPNLRLKDNLIQAACCLAGLAIGAGIGWYVLRDERDPTIGILFGALVGLVASVVISGVAIGIIRGKAAIKR